ncbi:MAG TPA: ATP-binding protein [Phycisphaerales bacterium]|nr:ATP-binding protein [Phycisphaerales bacterium]
MSLPLLTVAVRDERDVVLARQRGRQVAGLIGFDPQDQTRIATAISELARNAFRYARGGKVELSLEGNTPPQVLMIRVSDKGPGIRNLEHVLSGNYQSTTGMGLGLIGTRRMMDGFDIQSTTDGTTVTLKKILPRTAQHYGPREVARITDDLARNRPGGAFEEVQQQNQELLAALDELQQRQEELRRLNGELEDTNRGVVALYAELDDKADHLRRADELKTRFLSDMSHEFRTPLNSIIGISRILLAQIDGPLTEEQSKQVTLMESSARELLALVNDLLDLAKVEAGKVEVRPTTFRVSELFGALRGMLRPLLVADSVHLVFQEADDLPPLFTDEAKISQILRNFISNALKFTERGEVRVWASLDGGPDEPRVSFHVQDTGIGIPPEHLETIFQEFTQVDSPLQRKHRGTGLGLPLTRKLAELLGGSVSVESQPGLGSTFQVTVPTSYEGVRPQPDMPPVVIHRDPAKAPVLVIEDLPVDQMVCEKYLRGTAFQAVTVPNVSEARRSLREWKPAAILLDVMLGQENTWGLLTEIKRDPRLSGVPVFVVTTNDDEAKARMLGADAYCMKPLRRDWLLEQLTAHVGGGEA